jgi:hypothetical protein
VDHEESGTMAKALVEMPQLKLAVLYQHLRSVILQNSDRCIDLLEGQSCLSSLQCNFDELRPRKETRFLTDSPAQF